MRSSRLVVTLATVMSLALIWMLFASLILCDLVSQAAVLQPTAGAHRIRRL